MAVVALVLVGAAVIVTRTTRAYLVARVDDQLRAAGSPVRGGFRDRDGPGNGFNSLYVGVVQDGALVPVAVPNLSEEAPPLPRLSAADERNLAAGAQDPFTVGSTSSSVRYR